MAERPDARLVLEFSTDDDVEAFEVYDDFDELKGAEDGVAYPGSLIQAVAAELDIEHVEDLDI